MLMWGTYWIIMAHNAYSPYKDKHVFPYINKWIHTYNVLSCISTYIVFFCITTHKEFESPKQRENEEQILALLMLNHEVIGASARWVAGPVLGTVHHESVEPWPEKRWVYSSRRSVHILPPESFSLPTHSFLCKPDPQNAIPYIALIVQTALLFCQILICILYLIVCVNHITKYTLYVYICMEEKEITEWKHFAC